jgi:hypothetical protein
MLKPTFSKQRPTRAGFYLCWRVAYQPKPEVVEIRVFDKKLWYFGHITSMPLSKIERSALFSEAIQLKEDCYHG